MLQKNAGLLCTSFFFVWPEGPFPLADVPSAPLPWQSSLNARPVLDRCSRRPGCSELPEWPGSCPARAASASLLLACSRRASQLSLRWDLVKTCHVFSESLPKIQSSCLPNRARGEACVTPPWICTLAWTHTGREILGESQTCCNKDGCFASALPSATGWPTSEIFVPWT